MSRPTLCGLLTPHEAGAAAQGYRPVGVGDLPQLSGDVSGSSAVLPVEVHLHVLLLHALLGLGEGGERAAIGIQKRV